MSTRGERLQGAMAARGIRKQIVLAAEVGVNESAVSRWQQGAGLSLEHAVKLCETLDISLDWLVLGRGDMDQHHRAKTGSSERPVLSKIDQLPKSVATALMTLVDCIHTELPSTP